MGYRYEEVFSVQVEYSRARSVVQTIIKKKLLAAQSKI
jgi:hypothetical protein